LLYIIETSIKIHFSDKIIKRWHEVAAYFLRALQMMVILVGFIFISFGEKLIEMYIEKL